VHSLFEDLKLIVELCEQGALAERSRDEASLQLVCDVVARRNLLLGVGRLGQQLENTRRLVEMSKQKRHHGRLKRQCWLRTLHCMKGLRRTKIGMRVRTMKSMKSQKAKPPTFLRAISFTCRLSRYHWFPSERSKQTNTTFRAVEDIG